MALLPVSSNKTTASVQQTKAPVAKKTDSARLASRMVGILRDSAEMVSLNQRPSSPSRFKLLDARMGAHLAALAKDISTFKDPKAKADAQKALTYWRAEHNHQVWVATKLTGLASGARTKGVPKPIPARKAALEAAKASFARAQISRNQAISALARPVSDPTRTDMVEKTAKKLFIANRDITKAMDDVRKAMLADTTMGELVAYVNAGSRQSIETMLSSLAAPLTDSANTFMARVSSVVKNIARPAGFQLSSSIDQLNRNLEAFGAANALSATSAQLFNSIIQMARSVPWPKPGMLSGFTHGTAKKYARIFDGWSRTANFEAIMSKSQDAQRALLSVDTDIRRPILYAIARKIEPHDSGQSIGLGNAVRSKLSGWYAATTKPKSPGPSVTIWANSWNAQYDSIFRYLYELPNLNKQSMDHMFENNDVDFFYYISYNIGAIRNNSNIIFFKGNNRGKINTVDIYTRPFSSIRYFPDNRGWLVNGNVPVKVAHENLKPSPPDRFQD